MPSELRRNRHFCRPPQTHGCWLIDTSLARWVTARPDFSEKSANSVSCPPIQNANELPIGSITGSAVAHTRSTIALDAWSLKPGSDLMSQT